MLEEPINQVWEQDDVSNLNSSTSKTEQIQELVNTLVINYQQTGRREKPGRVLKSGLPERNLVGTRSGVI